MKKKMNMKKWLWWMGSMGMGMCLLAVSWKWTGSHWGAAQQASLVPNQSALPRLGALSAFELRDQNNEHFGLDNMKGTVHVINFIFTTCPGVCPLLTQRMRTIEKNTRHLGDNVRFISISVDPETDTPEALKEYGMKYNADFSRWTFLTGPLDAVEKVVIDGFKSSMGKRTVAAEGEDEPTLMQITHGEHFIVVDRKGQMRAFKNANTMDEVKEIVDMVSKL